MKRRTNDGIDYYEPSGLIRSYPILHLEWKPDKLHAEKAYDHVELREWVRDRGTAVRIARKGTETSQNSANSRRNRK